MRMGFNMRLQAIAAVHAKVLRLNSAAVAGVSPGTVRLWGVEAPGWKTR